MRIKLPRRSCKFCNILLNRPEKFFCNVQCQQDYYWSIRKKKIISDGVLPPSQRVGRRFMIERTGYKCSICKLEDWFGQKMPLVLDHIDGNSDNWSLSNMRMICPNCDTFTPFYKSKNKGNGRFKRRQRYLEGKSF